MSPSSLIALLLLTVLYALAWHDKPAPHPQHADQKRPAASRSGNAARHGSDSRSSTRNL